MNIGIIGLLQIIFITLKVTGNLAWSWLWVFSPLWIGVPVIFVLLFLVAIIAVSGKS